MSTQVARDRDSAQAPQQEPGQAALQRDPSDWVTGSEPMTEAQASYLQTLSKEAGEPFEADLTKADASKRIDELRQRTGRADAGQDAGAGPSAGRDAAPSDARNEAGRRTAREVIDEHLRLQKAGDIEADVEASYSQDVVLLTASGPHHGHDGVRLLARILADDLPDATFDYEEPVIERDYALVEWKARAGSAKPHSGADSYVIRGGKIVAQTIHYTPAQRKAR